VESLALDLKQEGAREVLESLLADADVLLTTFRPGALGRMGLAPEELRRRHPRLVIASLSGWGQDGPLARRAGHDLTYQATAGMLAATAAMPAIPVADVVGAWSTLSAILAALLRRERTGQGAVIDASLYDAALHANLIGWAAEAGRPRAVGEALALSGALPCYRLYPTADGGLLAVAALEPHFWRRFCELIERPKLVKSLYSREPAVGEEVAAAVAGRSREEWARLLAEEDLPVEVVLSAGEALAHPQAEVRGVVGREPGGELPTLAFPAKIDGRRPAARGGMPELGEHTAGVLAEKGLTPPPRTPAGRKQSGIGRRSGLHRLVRRLMTALRPLG
jgi:crotonobetainyl-CoA:carnitine CoA-transferase CaiB-like acyl-CoA transferase